MNDSIFEPEILNPDNPSDADRINELLSLKCVTVVDRFAELTLELVKIQNPGFPYKLHRERIDSIVAEKLAVESPKSPGVWVYYPWNNHIIHLLNEADFVEVRTNRNRYKIKNSEQKTLSKKVIGVAGLSVGRSISLTLAMERSFGEIRLADFDIIELSNLNRIQGSLNELGVNKAIAAAREIKQLDPFLKVKVYAEGLNEENMSVFFDDGGTLDLFIEECDGLDIKISSRIEAKKRGIPVFMEASDRCMIDVERFDEQNDRPILHGLVGDVNLDELKNLKSDEEKLPYLTKIVGVESLSTRMRASMLEIEQTITSWPQLAADVNKGGGIGAEIVRNILLDKSTGSGRFYIDTEELVPLEKKNSNGGKYSSYNRDTIEGLSSKSLRSLVEKHRSKNIQEAVKLSSRTVKKLLEAAHAAPSGGNTQPWVWVNRGNQFFIFHDRSRSHSLLDQTTSASRVALGCSVENIVLEAKRLGYSASISKTENAFPLIATVLVGSGGITNKEQLSLAKWIYGRSTNRTLATPTSDVNSKIDFMNEWASNHGGSVQYTTITDRDTIGKIADIVSNVERERILHPWGYHDYINEVRWTHSEHETAREGVNLASVELTKAEATGLRISRDPLVLDEFDAESSGKAFERLIWKSTNAGAGVGVIYFEPNSEIDWFDTGLLLEEVWLKLNSIGLELQPISPITFLYDAIETSSKMGDNNTEDHQLYHTIQSQHEKLKTILHKHIGQHELAFVCRIFGSNYRQDISLRTELNIDDCNTFN